SKFFAPGHDRWAEAFLTTKIHGSVAGFLAANGYGPSGKNAREEASQANRFFVQVTVRRTDPVDPRAVRQALRDAGGVGGKNGFVFPSQGAMEAAIEAVVSRYGSKYVCGGQEIGTVEDFLRR